MKTTHASKIFSITLGLLLLSLSFANVSSANGDPKRQYLVGTGFLCNIAPSFCPDVAKASNGDTVTISGSGTFNAASMHATGSGSFVHRGSTGTIKGFGTWTAEKLVSWTPGGFSTAGGLLPSGSEGGIAVLKVHISPATGGAGFTALLTILCGLNTPGVEEGINLNVVGVINFDSLPSNHGNTLFIQP
ncbi:MAG TPA: hypothetical protein VGR53_08775 [Nitrososphaerales archaeon]|nr:hypothetical protein [Nitrososphaerales archaeon]